MHADLRLENEVHPNILNLKDLIAFTFFSLGWGNAFLILILVKILIEPSFESIECLVFGEDDWRKDSVESSKIKDHRINDPFKFL